MMIEALRPTAQMMSASEMPRYKMMLKDLVPRLYQETIISTCINKNCLVVLPTGMGKTVIALMLASQRLNCFPNSKMLFLAPTRPLVEQHLETFKKHFDISEEELTVFTGNTPPEKREDLLKKAKIIFSTPQCVTGDAEIFSMKDGPIKIKDFVENFDLKKRKYGDKLGCYADIKQKVIGFSNGNVSFLDATTVWKLPANCLVNITTELKHELTCTPEHPLLTLDSKGDISWTKAEDIKKGTFVGIVKALSLPSKKIDLYKLLKDTGLRVIDPITKKSPDLKHKYSVKLADFLSLNKSQNLKLGNSILTTNYNGRGGLVRLPRYLSKEICYILGAMLGDGHIGDRRGHGCEVVFSELDCEEISNRFMESVNKSFNILPTSDKNKGLIYFSSTFADILEKLGVPKGNKTKLIRVPPFMFAQSEEFIGHFIGGFFNADGDAHKNMIRIASTSKQMIYDLKWLLLRLGIISYIEKRKAKMSNIQGRTINCSDHFILIISGRENIKNFLRICSPSEEKCHNLIKNLSKTKKLDTRSKDIFPVNAGIREAYLEHRKNGGQTLDDVRLTYHHKYLSTQNVKKILRKITGEKAKKLLKITNLPIRWVRIKSLNIKRENCFVYDLTVNKHHNFISNHLISHNTVENDIISNRINLEEISLLVFDEAHRATGEYAYNFIAKQYHRKARYPRILALTASPGSEIEKIDELCRNLFIEDVELRTDNDPDVLPYIQQITINTVKVELPAEFKRVHKHLKDCYNSKLNDVRELGRLDTSTINNGKTQLLKIQGILHSEIAKGDKSIETLKSVSLMAEAMKADHAIELLETQGIDQLSAYFERIYSEAIGTKVKAVKNLANDLNFKSAHILTKRLVEEKIEHPKIPALKKLVENEISKDAGKKIIIFSQFRDSAKKIHEILSSIDGVKAEIFVGQAKKNGLGLTQKRQKELLEEFSRGEFNCLIATSVAEEGIDIPCVDLVIFYEPIPSGIRSIQRRGRTGRQEKGRVVVLVTKETRDEGYKWSAFHKEKRMYRELEGLRTKFRGFSERQDVNLKKFISPDVELKVFADVREKASGVIKELIELGILIDLKTLDVGDYLLSERVGVEFKKIPDFVDSIVDGRLLEQIKNMKHSFERPLLILEGEEDIYSQRGLHPNAIRGMLAMITVSYGIPVIQTKNSKETAALIAVIAKREQDPEFREFNPHGSKKPLSLREQQEYIVSSVPGVGPGVAKSLLTRFGSVKGVFNAGVEELQEVEKVGEKRAKEVQRVLGEGYEKDKC